MAIARKLCPSDVFNDEGKKRDNEVVRCAEASTACAAFGQPLPDDPRGLLRLTAGYIEKPHAGLLHSSLKSKRRAAYDGVRPSESRNGCVGCTNGNDRPEIGTLVAAEVARVAGRERFR